MEFWEFVTLVLALGALWRAGTLARDAVSADQLRNVLDRVEALESALRKLRQTVAAPQEEKMPEKEKPVVASQLRKEEPLALGESAIPPGMTPKPPDVPARPVMPQEEAGAPSLAAEPRKDEPGRPAPPLEKKEVPPPGETPKPLDVSARPSTPRKETAVAPVAASAALPRQKKAPAKEPMACPSCGQEMPEGWSYCYHCRTVREAVPKEAEIAAGTKKESATRTPFAWGDLEERLGTNWLNKIGIVAFVIGFALLLNYSMAYVGPAGKIALGYVIGAALLVLGVAGEKHERYVIPARAVLGGGWAVIYATTYAMHNIDAVRLVESPTLGFLLLFAVAAAMVTHSLRYNSQVATGFAYMLAYASVAVSQITLGALTASALLTTSLVLVLWRRRWYQLEPWAVLATYGIHWFWLRQEFDILGGKRDFPELAASFVLLTLYWILFTASHFLRDERAEGARLSLTYSLLVNAGAYVAVLRYQSLHPEWSFSFLLGLGTAYLALAVYSRRASRRLGFLLTSTLGTGFVFIAVPYKFAGAPLEYLWLVEVEALLFLGWRAAEPHLRRLGWIAAGILAPYVFYQHILNRLLVEHESSLLLGGLLVGLAAAYLVNAQAAPRLLGIHGNLLDRISAGASSPLGVAVLMTAVWVALPWVWVAPVWALLSLGLYEAARRLSDDILVGSAHAIAAATVVRLLAVNSSHELASETVSLRLVTMTLSAIVLFLAARRIHAAAIKADNALRSDLVEAFGGTGVVAPLYTWAGVFVSTLMIGKEAVEREPALTLACLALAFAASLLSSPIATGFVLAALWVQLPAVWVAPAWILLAFALREVGGHWDRRVLRACGHGVMALAALRLTVVNLLFTEPTGPVSLRLVTVTLSAILMFLYVRRLRPAALEAAEVNEWLRAFGGAGLSGALIWVATFLAGIMIGLELSSEGAALTVAVFAIAGSAALVSYPIATAFLLTGSWLALRSEWAMWVAPTWMGLALVIHELGLNRRDRVLLASAHGVVSLVLLRVGFFNMVNTTLASGISLRLLTAGLTLGLLYLYAERMRRGVSPIAQRPQETLAEAVRTHLSPQLATHFTWLATGLIALLIWLEATTAAIALVWGLFGLTLLEAGRARSDNAYFLQGYSLLALSFGRIFIADLNASPMVLRDVISARLLTVPLLAVTYYCGASITPARFSRWRNLLLWFAMAALAALARFELAADWVIVGWGGLAVVLYLAAGRLGIDTFRHQTYFVVLLVAVRSGFDNLFQSGGLWNFTTVRMATIIAACLFLYALLLLEKFGPTWLRESAAAVRATRPASKSKIVRAAHWLDGHPQHLFFFAPTVLLTVLLSLEVPSGYLTASWGLEGLLLFILALGLGERTFRWYSLGLLLLCIGKIAWIDVWTLEAIGRIVSLMGLGAALLLVSFLYARYREAWRRYL